MVKKQIGRFLAIGLIGAIIDFGILNLASWLTDVRAGVIVGWINAPGFILANLFTYFGNRHWVFTDQLTPVGNPFNNLPKFSLIALSGLLLNSLTIVILTTYFMPPPFGLGAVIWLNFSKAVASAVAAGWNFSGYKFFAFKKYENTFHRRPGLERTGDNQ